MTDDVCKFYIDQTSPIFDVVQKCMGGGEDVTKHQFNLGPFILHEVSRLSGRPGLMVECQLMKPVQETILPVTGLVSSPIPMRLHCPQCHELHIDEGEFATKPHHTHACQHCGNVWRPAIVSTVGVKFLPGFKNS